MNHRSINRQSPSGFCALIPSTQVFGSVLAGLPLRAPLMAACFGVVTFCACATQATAQGMSNYSSSAMWGTSSAAASVAGAAESATAHVMNGNIAGQVNAARRGLLISTGATITVNTIGSQTLVNTSITGSDNSVNIDSHQTSSNTGSVDADVDFETVEGNSNIWDIRIGH